MPKIPNSSSLCSHSLIPLTETTRSLVFGVLCFNTVCSFSASCGQAAYGPTRGRQKPVNRAQACPPGARSHRRQLHAEGYGPWDQTVGFPSATSYLSDLGQNA